MAYDLTRRGFLASTAATATALALPRFALADMSQAAPILKGSGKVVVSTGAAPIPMPRRKGCSRPSPRRRASRW